jgi:hypothetical protein
VAAWLLISLVVWGLIVLIMVVAGYPLTGGTSKLE